MYKNHQSQMLRWWCGINCKRGSKITMNNYKSGRSGESNGLNINQDESKLMRVGHNVHGNNWK